MGHSHTIAFLVFDGVKMLDVAGPAEVFAEANKLGARYSLTYLSPSGDPVSTSIGLPLPVDSDSSQLTRMDTLVVPGGDDLPSKPIPTELVDAVQSLHRRSQRLVAICTGAFILAKAGILDHRQATTHWEHARLLAAAYPDIRVRPDSLFVADGEVFTSAGVSAGIDLALALVERDHGASIARLIAQRLVLFMQRPGGQSQFSAPYRSRPPRTSRCEKPLNSSLRDPTQTTVWGPLPDSWGSAHGRSQDCSPPSSTPLRLNLLSRCAWTTQKRCWRTDAASPKQQQPPASEVRRPCGGYSTNGCARPPANTARGSMQHVSLMRLRGSSSRARARASVPPVCA